MIRCEFYGCGATEVSLVQKEDVIRLVEVARAKRGKFQSKPVKMSILFLCFLL